MIKHVRFPKDVYFADALRKEAKAEDFEMAEDGPWVVFRHGKTGKVFKIPHQMCVLEVEDAGPEASAAPVVPATVPRRTVKKAPPANVPA